MIKLFGIIIDVDEQGSPTTLSGTSDDPETSSVNKDIWLSNDTSSSDDNISKKPDKLVPCPRCSSMDTKFCYFNNYNVSQPRYLCKNCQRYWTAGGVMRSVPVGSGRRKNKSSPTSQYGHVNGSKGIYQLNGCLLAFGSDSLQCEPLASAISYGAQVISDDKSSGSSSTVLNHHQEVFNNGVESKLTNIQESVPCFPVPPWASPWNTAEWMSATQPAFGLLPVPGFPISVYSIPPYWGCPVPNPWKMPLLSDPQGPDSQTPGKHSRDGSTTRSSEPEKVEEGGSLKRQLLNPTNLRIHDPIEAAERTLWLTLGIKNEHIMFQKNHMTKVSTVLQESYRPLD